MPQSLAQIYLHIVFGTKNRYPFIERDIDTELYAFTGASIKRLGGMPVEIGGTDDHIHILTSFPRTITVADFVKDIKANSSRWIKTKGDRYRDFAWQEGYGVFSVSASGKQRVSDYIVNQRRHHGKLSFQEEFLAFLEKYNVEYDERYLWD